VIHVVTGVDTSSTALVVSTDDLEPSERDQRARRYLLAARAESTRRAYASDWVHFTDWCTAQSDDLGRPYEALPAAAETVALYLARLRGTGKRNLVAAGVTTDVCLVPPALSAKAEGFEVVVLLDISAATTKIAALNSRDLLHAAGIPLLTVIPMITNMLGDFNVPAAAGLYEAMEAEGVFDAFARGNLR